MFGGGGVEERLHVLTDRAVFATDLNPWVQAPRPGYVITFRGRSIHLDCRVTTLDIKHWHLHFVANLTRRCLFLWIIVFKAQGHTFCWIYVCLKFTGFRNWCHQINTYTHRERERERERERGRVRERETHRERERVRERKREGGNRTLQTNSNIVYIVVTKYNNIKSIWCLFYYWINVARAQDSVTGFWHVVLNITGKWLVWCNIMANINQSALKIQR